VQAEALCRVVLDRRPGDAQANYVRGLAQRATNRLDAAQASFDAALTGGFSAPAVRLEMARLGVLRGDAAAAETVSRIAANAVIPVRIMRCSFPSI
jgi:hypothetical protein